jgi:6-phosphogluconate dehydrogenase
MGNKAAKEAGVADIGVMGMAVMGKNLALNMADHGFRVAVWNRKGEITRRVVDENPDTPGGLVGSATLPAFVRSIKRPRRIVVLIKAGPAIDSVLQNLLKLVDRGDVIVDGGNSLWTDTIRRERLLAERGIHFVGSGVSGGELGARFGPSLMPGGSKEAWRVLRPVWKAIAARVDPATGKEIEGAVPGKPVRGGVPCTAHIGSDGAGHYVKMVHNGIEYADMQLISEAYFLLARLGGMKPLELSGVFGRWNRGDLDSFLIEITADILQQKDPVNRRRYLIDAILDTAGQKGTGKWTSANALDLGVPAATIAEAVFARFASALKDERVAASKKLRGPRGRPRVSKRALVEAVHDALFCSKICAYAQGFALMDAARREYGWKLRFGEIANIWRGGCIIRARFLHHIGEAYGEDPRLRNLMLAPYFRRKLHAGQAGWRKVVSLAAEAGVASPAFMSALAYFDSYREGRLPANLLQAQRDYFGAHTFERVDRPRGRFFHVDWPDAAREMSDA